MIYAVLVKTESAIDRIHKSVYTFHSEESRDRSFEKAKEGYRTMRGIQRFKESENHFSAKDPFLKNTYIQHSKIEFENQEDFYKYRKEYCNM